MVSKIHLVVLVHGLWGNPSHVENLGAEVLKAHPFVDGKVASESEEGNGHAEEGAGGEVEVVVLNTIGNAADKTYDGVDFCAGRVVQEIEQEIERLEEGGEKKVVYFSIAGYSLGGLVARCAIGILHSQTPSFFDSHAPLNFATFASPWLGMPRYSTYFSSFAAGVGSRMLGRTGEQLYIADKEALVARMARKGDVFYQALELFEKVDVYANTIRDRTVPFVTGSFSSTDPFADFETNGLEVETYPDLPLIKSFKLPPPSISSLSKPSKPWYSLSRSSKPKSTRPKRPFLPPFLRFKFPLNIIFIISLPLVIPVMMALVLYRFNNEGRRSRKRLVSEEGKGVKERLRVLERELEEYVEEGLDLDLGVGGGGEDESEVELVVGGTKTKKGGDGGLLLTDAQKSMIRSLDELPRLKKHLVWFPDAFNSHAVIISRDPKGFPDHALGRVVLKHWAEGMEVSA